MTQLGEKLIAAATPIEMNAVGTTDGIIEAEASNVVVPAITETEFFQAHDDFESDYYDDDFDDIDDYYDDEDDDEDDEPVESNTVSNN